MSANNVRTVLLVVAVALAVVSTGQKTIRPFWSVDALTENIPVVTSNREYIYTCIESQVTCLSLSSGKTLWTAKVGQYAPEKYRNSLPITPYLIRGHVLATALYYENKLDVIDQVDGSVTTLDMPNGQAIASIIPAKGEALICLKGSGALGSRLMALTFDLARKPILLPKVQPQFLWNIEPKLFVLDGEVCQVLNQDLKVAFIGGMFINYENFPMAKRTTKVWSMPEGWGTFITSSGVEERRTEMPMERPIYSLSLWSAGGLGRQYWSHSSYVGDGYKLYLAGSEITVWKGKVWASSGNVYRILKEPDSPFQLVPKLAEVFVSGDALIGKGPDDQIYRTTEGERFKLLGVLAGTPASDNTESYAYSLNGGILRWVRTKSNGKFVARLEFFKV